MCLLPSFFLLRLNLFLYELKLTGMISVEQARAILQSQIQPLAAVELMLVSEALGFRLAENVIAPLDLPPFNQSNVDGYALGSVSASSWNVIGEIPAGNFSAQRLQPGEAMRIFTGAAVPAGCECVVMQEFVSRQGDLISCSRTDVLVKFNQIRPKASQIKKGDEALASGLIINPAVISFLQALGLQKIKVFRKPRLALIITGNELQPPGEKLGPGKNYESNAAALLAAIGALGLSASPEYATDTKEALRLAINKCADADVLLISGGISVGDYDHVKAVLTEAETTCLFHGIAQKPGKPLYFGKRDQGFVFGLPGNPASALTCFYEYVLPALRLLQGRKTVFLEEREAILKHDVFKKSGLTHFLKGRLEDGEVEALEGQDSYIMKSFAAANVLICLPAESSAVARGGRVNVHLLPEY
jgi:molybdopterin molybdotransferase